MSVKTEKVEKDQEEIVDDVSHLVVTDDAKEEVKVDEDKLAALKAKMAEKESKTQEEPKKEEPKGEEMPPRIFEKKERTLEFGVIGSGQAGCIDGKTHIYVSDFGIVPIERLFYQMMNTSSFDKVTVRSDNQTCIDISDQNFYTVSIDPQSGEIKKSKILAVWKNRRNSYNKITTSNNMSLGCSKTHPSLIFRPFTRRKAYWKSLADTNPLSIGDRLVDTRSIAIDLISSKTFVRNIEVTKDIAWVIGLFIGDGSNKSSGNEISFYLEDPGTLEKFLRVIKHIPHTSIKVNDAPGCKKVCLYGLNARLFFESALGFDSYKAYGGFGKKTYTVEIPKCISSAHSEIRASFFAGIIDSDGTVCKDWCETSFSTCSKLLADQACCLLSSIGARSSLEISNNDKKNEKTVYRVRINGKLNHGPLLNDIICNMAHNVRKDRLIYWAENEQKSFTTSSVPLSFDELNFWMKSEGGMKTVNSLSVSSGVSLKCWSRGERHLSIPSFKKMIESLNESEQLKYVKLLSNMLIEINSIESVDNCEFEFFDLTVEGQENYLAGNNGFIFTHNSRVAETWYKLGYDAVAFNTAQQDLAKIEIPEGNKCFLDYSLGGASKDQNIGHEAAQMHRDLIYNTVVDKLGDSQVFVFCTSLGGGSGGGSIETIIDVMNAIGKPVIVITVLPMTNEDAQTKKNSLEALSKLAKEVQNNRVQNLIVVDNAKIEYIFQDLSPMQFYKVSNEAIVEPLDVFNRFSTKDSDVKAIDNLEFTKILIDGQGLSLYGSMTVNDWEEEDALAEAVISNLNAGLLAEGFDLKQTKYVGVMFMANQKVWDKLPAASIHYAMEMVKDTAGIPAGDFKGLYVDESMTDDVVKVYSFFSGLALPDSRVSELKKEVKTQSAALQSKEVQRNMNLSLDTGESETKSQAERIKERIKSKSSSFGKFTKGVVDKRRK